MPFTTDFAKSFFGDNAQAAAPSATARPGESIPAPGLRSDCQDCHGSGVHTYEVVPNDPAGTLGHEECQTCDGTGTVIDWDRLYDFATSIDRAIEDKELAVLKELVKELAELLA